MQDSKREVVCEVLEDVTDRACKRGFPNGMSLCDFVDWIRGLYPEYYISIRSQAVPKSENMGRDICHTE